MANPSSFAIISAAFSAMAMTAEYVFYIKADQWQCGDDNDIRNSRKIHCWARWRDLYSFRTKRRALKYNDDIPATLSPVTP